MSDSSQGEGWWIASDGKWYPPQAAPTPPAAVPPAPEAQQPPTQPQQPVHQPPPAPGEAQGQQPPPAPGQAPGTPPPFPGAPGTPDTPGGPPGTPGGPPGTPGGPDEDDDSKGGKGKWIALLIALLIVLLLIAGGIAAFFLLSGDDDDGDSDVDGSGDDTGQETDIGDATGELTDDGKIEFDKEYTAALEADRTEARYTLDAPAGAIMTLKVANDAASTSGVYATFESQGDRYLEFRTAPGAEETEQVILAADGEAPFELIFTEGPAEFTFSVGLEIQDDAGEGGDAGAELDSAFAIEAGQGVAGMLGGKDETDHFTVDLQPGTELTMTAATSADSERGSYFTVELAGDQLFGERVAPGAETDLSMLLSEEDSGTLEVIVTEGPANYTFTVGFVEQNDGGEPGDAPAELADAREAAVSTAIEGTVGDRDEGDYYLFTAPSAAFNVTATGDAGNDSGFYVTVQNASGANVAGFRVAAGATETKPVEVEAGSQVRLVITEGRAKYSVKVG